MKPEIEDCFKALESSCSEIVKLVKSLDESQLHWRSDAGVWSVCDCVKHLISSAEAVLPVQREAIAKGRERNILGEGPFRYGFIGRKFLEMLAPPPKRKFKAPKMFSPDESVRPTCADLLERFSSMQVRALEVVSSADGLDLRRVRVSSPVTSLLRFNLGVSLMILSTHQRRHYWQMCRVIENLQFPKTTITLPADTSSQ